MRNLSFTIVAITCLLINACTTQTEVQDIEPMDMEQNIQGTAWWVEDIAGKGVIDMSHTTIEFLEDGKVAGDTGCNRYFGGYEITGEKITFGPLAGTRKACAASLMDQEMAFYEAMGKVSRWEIADTGLLHLRDAEGEGLIRAWKTDQ